MPRRLAIDPQAARRHFEYPPNHGGGFTVADLNVASILAWARPAQIDMSPFPKVAEWLKNCAERPAARAARQLQRE